MAYKLRIYNKRHWKKDCEKIPEKVLVSILRKIRSLEKNPWPENINVKRLSEYELADYRLRVGEYRIVFDIVGEPQTVVLYRVLHRSKLY